VVLTPNWQFLGCATIAFSEQYVGNASLYRHDLSNWAKVGNQAKPPNYSEKKIVFRTNFEQMFKRTANDIADKNV